MGRSSSWQEFVLNNCLNDLNLFALVVMVTAVRFFIDISKQLYLLFRIVVIWWEMIKFVTDQNRKLSAFVSYYFNLIVIARCNIP